MGNIVSRAISIFHHHWTLSIYITWTIILITIPISTCHNVSTYKQMMNPGKFASCEFGVITCHRHSKPRLSCDMLLKISIDTVLSPRVSQSARVSDSWDDCPPSEFRRDQPLPPLCLWRMPKTASSTVHTVFHWKLWSHGPRAWVEPSKSKTKSSITTSDCLWSWKHVRTHRGSDRSRRFDATDHSWSSWL